jgi:hypothetical protein
MAGNDGSTSSAQDVVMEEEVDPGYEPGQREIDEYAQWLGMDPKADEELLWIAREGLKVSQGFPARSVNGRRGPSALSADH